MAEKSEKQKGTRKVPKSAWKPNQSGNPKGRPVDPGRKEALEILKDAAPAITQKALSMVLCEQPNSTVLKALIAKIFPDNLNITGALALATLSDDQLKSRLLGLIGAVKNDRSD